MTRKNSMGLDHRQHQVSSLKIKASVLLFSLFVMGWAAGSSGDRLLWASSSHIQIQHRPPYFSPTHMRLFPGTSITWENSTPEPHSIVSDDCASLSHCSFDSGLIRPHSHFELTHLAPGRYAYHCGIHPFMRGILTIQAPQSFSSDI